MSRAQAKLTPTITPTLSELAPAADSVTPPRWAIDRVDRPASNGHANPRRAGSITIDVTDGGPFALTTARLIRAADLDAASLERRVTEAYAAIVANITKLSASRPVRLWNHIPSIHEQMDARRDRYMVFNAGRYRAFADMYGGPQAFGQEVATASGVGHNGEDLVIHCLSARTSGVAVENPRQIAPHEYSKRYGPLPPCFARATVLTNEIFVGGTASIRGEDSLFPASLQLQMTETLTNLASVVEAAHAKSTREPLRLSRENWLRCFRDVRVYHPRPADADALATASRHAFGPACRIEMRRADLCRAELLVEIEGVATFEP